MSSHSTLGSFNHWVIDYICTSHHVKLESFIWEISLVDWVDEEANKRAINRRTSIRLVLPTHSPPKEWSGTQMAAHGLVVGVPFFSIVAACHWFLGFVSALACARRAWEHKTPHDKWFLHLECAVRRTSGGLMFVCQVAHCFGRHCWLFFLCNLETRKRVLLLTLLVELSVVPIMT